MMIINALLAMLPNDIVPMFHLDVEEGDAERVDVFRHSCSVQCSYAAIYVLQQLLFRECQTLLVNML